LPLTGSGRRFHSTERLRWLLGQGGATRGEGNQVNVESEYYYHPSRAAVLVNVTDLYEAELRKVLAEVSEHFSWGSIQYDIVSDDDGELSEWAWLHDAVEKPDVGTLREESLRIDTIRADEAEVEFMHHLVVLEECVDNPEARSLLPTASEVVRCGWGGDSFPVRSVHA
jgi:hypothetical protein